MNKSVPEVNVRSRYNVNIIAVRHDNTLQPSPVRTASSKSGNHLVVLGKATDMFKLGGKTES